MTRPMERTTSEGGRQAHDQGGDQLSQALQELAHTVARRATSSVTSRVNATARRLTELSASDAPTHRKEMSNMKTKMSAKLSGAGTKLKEAVPRQRGNENAQPVRIATIFDDDDRVRDVLADHRSAFVDTIDLLAGRTEWGVKVYAAPNGTADVSGGTPTCAPEDTTPSGQRSGTAYLLRRRAQLRARETAEHLAARDAGRVHTELGSLAVAVRRHPPQDSRLTGTRANMVLNAAYLVDDARAGHFAEAVSELDAQRPLLHLYLTGPWPPYSFSRIAEVTA